MSTPIYDTPILGMKTRPHVDETVVYGNAGNFWVEYPTGLVDLTRSQNFDFRKVGGEVKDVKATPEPPALDAKSQVEIAVDGDRKIRVDTAKTALVVIDMQNFFLHPNLRDHPKGLACVDPLLHAIPPLREAGAKIIWVNWGLTDHELHTIPPGLVRGFMKGGKGGFGGQLEGDFGRLLMRDAFNSELYGPLQPEYEKGVKLGTDVWIHKNRMSGLWGPQTALDLYLQEQGITTLLFSGVNADQCVLGTVIDSYYRGYDVILVEDATATTSPEGGFENVVYNIGNSYGFVTDTKRIASGAVKH